MVVKKVFHRSAQTVLRSFARGCETICARIGGGGARSGALHESGVILCCPNDALLRAVIEHDF